MLPHHLLSRGRQKNESRSWRTFLKKMSRRDGKAALPWAGYRLLLDFRSVAGFFDRLDQVGGLDFAFFDFDRGFAE